MTQQYNVAPSQYTMQDLAYPKNRNYREGSPHLQHWSLLDQLVELVRGELGVIADRGLPKTVLEIGAGHGGFTDYVLAGGFSATVTEMSTGSAEYLRDKYRTNENFSVVLDRDGTLSGLGGAKYSMILCVSVLHHIPDYITFLRESVDRHLAVGGSLVCLQDPIWYPALDSRTLLLGRSGYLAWRVSKGNYAKGLRTRLRRMRGYLDPSDPDDNAEYHIVRSGVNNFAISDELKSRFSESRLVPYWSTQAELFQWLGERLGARNTFAYMAHGFTGSST
jgi:phospholipid N-methyltransferase